MAKFAAWGTNVTAPLSLVPGSPHPRTSALPEASVYLLPGYFPARSAVSTRRSRLAGAPAAAGGAHCASPLGSLGAGVTCVGAHRSGGVTDRAACRKGAHGGGAAVLCDAPLKSCSQRRSG